MKRFFTVFVGHYILGISLSLFVPFLLFYGDNIFAGLLSNFLYIFLTIVWPLWTVADKIYGYLSFEFLLVLNIVWSLLFSYIAVNVPAIRRFFRARFH